MWDRDLAGSVHTWEISACGVATLVGSVQRWEISACVVALLISSVQTWEISACGVALLLAVLLGTRSSVRIKVLGWD